MTRRPQEDLFEGTKMTFGEHIEELRGSLFQAIIGLFLGVIVGFYVANEVVKFIQIPLENALYEYYLVRAKERAAAEYQGKLPYEMLVTIERHSVTPAKMKVSAEALHEILRQSAPELYADLSFQPSGVTAADLTSNEVLSLLETWTSNSENRETPEGYLWSLLSSEERRRLEEIQTKESLNTKEVQFVAATLNNLLERPWSSAPPFQDVTSGDDYMDEAIDDLRAGQDESGQLSPQQSRRLNRLLLTAVFPGSIEKPSVTLVDLPFWQPIRVQVQSLGAQEAFMIWLKAAFITGMMISAPWVFLKIWQFVAAGLYPHEKHYIYLYLPISLLLFFGGAALAFFFVFQPVLSFLFSFNKSMNIDPDPRISEWLSFVLFLPLGFGISFQLPLVMLFLQRIGIFSVEMYVAKWRIAILAIFVISMVLTPADPISMLLMACPLTVLYFGGLAMCKWMPRGRNPYSELQAYEP